MSESHISVPLTHQVEISTSFIVKSVTYCIYNLHNCQTWQNHHSFISQLNSHHFHHLIVYTIPKIIQNEFVSEFEGTLIKYGQIEFTDNSKSALFTLRSQTTPYKIRLITNSPTFSKKSHL